MTDGQSFRRQLETGLKEQMPHVPLPPRTHRPVHPIKAEPVSVAGEGSNAQAAMRERNAGERGRASATGMNGHAGAGAEVKTELRDGEYEGMINGGL